MICDLKTFLLNGHRRRAAPILIADFEHFFCTTTTRAYMQQLSEKRRDKITCWKKKNVEYGECEQYIFKCVIIVSASFNPQLEKKIRNKRKVYHGRRKQN